MCLFSMQNMQKQQADHSVHAFSCKCSSITAQSVKEAVNLLEEY